MSRDLDTLHAVATASHNKRAIARGADPNKLFTLRYKLRSGMAIITAWDANTPMVESHARIDCDLRQNGRVIFPRGATYCGLTRNYAVDGTHARELVSSLLAMKPGDTDSEYFESYTPEQLAWAEANGEELSLLSSDRYCDPETGDVERGAS